MTDVGYQSSIISEKELFWARYKEGFSVLGGERQSIPMDYGHCYRVRCHS